MIQDTGTGNRMANNIRHLVVFVLLVLVLKSIATLGRIGILFLSDQAASTPSGPMGLFVLAADELINLSCQARLVLLLLFRHQQFSAHWIADACLLLTAVNLPVFNLVAIKTLPGFTRGKNYIIFYPFYCAIVGFVLPPAHMLAYWIISGPVFMCVVEII